MQKSSKEYRNTKIVVGIASGLAAIMLGGNTVVYLTHKGDYNKDLMNTARTVSSELTTSLKDVRTITYNSANQYIAKPLGLDKWDEPLKRFFGYFADGWKAISGGYDEEFKRQEEMQESADFYEYPKQ